MNKRIESVDVLRGLTMALMLIVDNPGGVMWGPFNHAEWIGFTPTDLVFPTFIFVMGVSMFLSLSKQQFKLSWKILKRFLSLFFLGLAIAWFSKGLFRGNWGFEGLRILGVLQRIALCYGISALIVCTVNHKWLGWIAGGLLAAYSVVLLLGNGYVYGPENILAKVDNAVLGEGHVYRWCNGLDPEGVLSTIPAVAHTLIGFMMGKLLMDKDFRKMDMVATMMLLGGFALMWVLPLCKKNWSPSFVLVACGIATLLLSLLHWLIDEKKVWKHTGFWKVFGTNAILSYLLCDCLVWLMGKTGWHSAVMKAVGNNYFTSLLYAVAGMLIIYALVYPLYKKKIFIKL